MAAAHWQLPQLAFALSQHHRVGAASPAHQLPHELVREVLLRVCAEEVGSDPRVAAEAWAERGGIAAQLADADALELAGERAIAAARLAGLH